MATEEQAKLCPKCGQPGKQVRVDVGPKGSKIFTYHCQKELCPWVGTGWVVQVRDGEVVERDRGIKEFESLSSADKAIAERMINEVRER
jgi:hypothetical protein